MSKRSNWRPSPEFWEKLQSVTREMAVIRVMRFTNRDVLGNNDGMTTIYAVEERKKTPPRPSPIQGRENYSDARLLGKEALL